MIHRLLTGAEFNAEYLQDTTPNDRSLIFVKLTNQYERHHGYSFRTGVNRDSVPFNPKGDCSPGGIYFCSMDQLSLWLNYGFEPMFYVRSVTIPDDAQIWVEENKFKADCLILGDRQLISDLDVWFDAEYCLRACQLNAIALYYVNNQTEDICLASVRQDGRCLQYVEDQTVTICLAAVQQNGSALRYVLSHHLTEEINLQAVKRWGHAIQFIKEPTETVCLAAIEQNCLALQFIKNQTEAICLAAVSQNGLALTYVRDHLLTETICLAAVSECGSAIVFVPDPIKANLNFHLLLKSYLLKS